MQPCFTPMATKGNDRMTLQKETVKHFCRPFHLFFWKEREACLFFPDSSGGIHSHSGQDYTGTLLVCLFCHSLPCASNSASTTRQSCQWIQLGTLHFPMCGLPALARGTALAHKHQPSTREMETSLGVGSACEDLGCDAKPPQELLPSFSPSQSLQNRERGGTSQKRVFNLTSPVNLMGKTTTRKNTDLECKEQSTP